MRKAGDRAAPIRYGCEGESDRNGRDSPCQPPWRQHGGAALPLPELRRERICAGCAKYDCRPAVGCVGSGRHLTYTAQGSAAADPTIRHGPGRTLARWRTFHTISRNRQPPGRPSAARPNLLPASRAHRHADANRAEVASSDRRRDHDGDRSNAVRDAADFRAAVSCGAEGANLAAALRAGRCVDIGAYIERPRPRTGAVPALETGNRAFTSTGSRICAARVSAAAGSRAVSAMDDRGYGCRARAAVAANTLLRCAIVEPAAADVGFHLARAPQAADPAGRAGQHADSESRRRPGGDIRLPGILG